MMKTVRHDRKELKHIENSLKRNSVNKPVKVNNFLFMDNQERFENVCLGYSIQAERLMNIVQQSTAGTITKDWVTPVQPQRQIQRTTIIRQQPGTHHSLLFRIAPRSMKTIHILSIPITGIQSHRLTKHPRRSRMLTRCRILALMQRVLTARLNWWMENITSLSTQISNRHWWMIQPMAAAWIGCRSFRRSCWLLFLYALSESLKTVNDKI